MSESKELKQIKKLYGEKFMHLCREIFPTLLEQEGLLTEVLTSTFSTNSKTLYEDIKENRLEEKFKNYIYSKVDVEKERPEIIEEKTPYELLEEAGYDLYECHTEEEIQKFKKYYKPGEELCTFNGGRLDRCVVFWAVKKDAEKIKREDFKKPKREDEYGTSVMGIQFNRKGKCTVSIKNRYNHTVNNPDATYGNDLDRIKTGLEKSFATLLQKEYGLELNNTNKEKFEIPGYTVAGDGKYYKYNMEINGIYYCPGNIIINHGTIEHLEPEKQILIDYFILDKENKKIELYDKELEDSFIDGFKDIEAIEVRKANEKEKGARIITIKKHNSDKPIIIEIDKDNQIKSYINEELIEVGNYFLNHNKELSQLELPSLEKVGSDFLYYNKGLSQLELPKLKEVGNDFLSYNKELSQLVLPNLEVVGDDFLCDNEGLSQLELPNLEKVGDYFLRYNKELSQLKSPKLKEVGDRFLYCNEELSQLGLPNLEKVRDFFLLSNKKLSQLELPDLTESKEKLQYILYVVEKNKKETQKSEIKPKDIAELDKDNSITITEINDFKKIIEREIDSDDKTKN